jgi:hypothetical protein
MLGACLLRTGVAMCQTGEVVGVFLRAYLCLCVTLGSGKEGHGKVRQLRNGYCNAIPQRETKPAGGWRRLNRWSCPRSA